MYHAFFRLLPYQYNPSLGRFRKCHSLAPHERQTNSVILLNNGQHFITSTKFSIYRKVIDGIVDLFKETKKNERCEVELKFKGKIIRTTNRGSQREILRKKTYKKQEQNTNKAFWSHFKHVGRFLGNIYLFLTPSKTDGRVPKRRFFNTTGIIKRPCA